MTDRQLNAELIRDVLGIDPHALTEAQFERAAEATYRTERGGELADELIRRMSDEEITDGIIRHRFGLEANRLTPEQRARLLAVVDEECRLARTVPEGEWNELRDWLEANRDRVKAVANLEASGCGQLIDLPDGRRVNKTNLVYRMRHDAHDGLDAREIAADVRTLRDMIEGVRE